MESEPVPNRLIREKSPYLLQHAYNPVDWYAWGEEALEKAKTENKPIFLSIGYSTCHWCHVMEEESFVNPQIAKILNEHYVPIKVDREERPDLDHIYMQAVMALTGSGGWPMSVFLTPEGKPFYGGTYFPPDDRWGRPGFAKILTVIAGKWKTDQDKVKASSEEITEAVRKEASPQEAKGSVVREEVLRAAYQQYELQYDPELGGFGQAPKFPRSHIVSFLFHYGKRFKESSAVQMAEKTLEEMARGGMYDQLGGGFHRYSTDNAWRIPHFEKMLYDQAILSRTYLEAYQATGKENYAKIAKEIFEYLFRDMTDKQGGFYSAEDADSLDPSRSGKKSEGAFYLWTPAEIVSVLGKDRAEIVIYYFGVLAEGNALQDPHNEFRDKSVLYEAHTVEETARKFAKSAEEVKLILKESKQKLFDARKGRPRPHLDDKVLTGWNGLMIASLALGSRVLNDESYARAASRAADFLLAKMKRRGGRLLHRYRDGETAIDGFLEDYAFLAYGLFELYEATFEIRYLEEAKSLAVEMHRLFWDEKGKGFFFSGEDSEKLISRTKDFYDGAIPSANSIAALVLLKVGRLTMDVKMEKWGRETLDAFFSQAEKIPSAFPQMLIAADFALGPSREIVIAGTRESVEVKEMLKLIHSRFSPNQVLIFHSMDEDAPRIEALAPFVASQLPIDGKATAYVCRNHTCLLPTTDNARLSELLAD